MIRLADFLLRWTGDPAFADYIERNRVNGLLAQQHPETGMVAYFLPLQAGAKKEWSTPTHTFTCCLGTVVQANAHHVDGIFYESAEGLAIAQYIPSTLRWQCGAAAVTVDLSPEQADPGYNPPVRDAARDHRPMEEAYRVHVLCDEPVDFALRLRLPWWLAGPAQVAINGGRPQAAAADKDGWHVVRRTWRDDTVHVALPKALGACPMPDAPGMVAFMEGPTVLAGLVDGERTLVGDPSRPADVLTPADERQWGRWLTRYRTRGQDHNFHFVPLYQVDKDAYTVYFEMRPPAPGGGR
jgi:DUF1680 family protein